jgi:hypothetical protein
LALVVLAFAPVALDMTDVMQSDAVSWRLLFIGGLPTWLVTAFVWRKRAGLGRREEAEAREALVAAATCLNEHRATAGSYPDTIALACGEVARSMAKNRSHRFTYVPKARVAGGQAEKYELTARAVPRSVFIESYFIDDSGAVHATGERRPATASDPAR